LCWPPTIRGPRSSPVWRPRSVFHTLPFLISSYSVAIVVAVIVVAVELVVLAALRSIFFRTSFASSFVSVTLGGAIIATVSAGLGVAAG
jgi:VIT1/CCC1 family predicted Fe2+/Mn2+ transporter